jgi:glycosidase
MNRSTCLSASLALALGVSAAAAEPRITRALPVDGGWQLTVEGVDSPEVRLDGQPVAATRAGDAWQFTTGAAARRLVVGDGKRDLLALRLLPDTPADAPFNDWTIYHLMLADFANGAANNDRSGMRRWVHSGYSGGDLQGVLGKVDHLKALGVNAVWLSPLFASETSHGYDVMNYYRVGDAVSVPRDREAAMQLYQRTVEALHGAGIRVVLDLPLNHGSGSYERQAGDPKGLKPKATSAQQEAEKTWDSWNAGFRYWNFADAGTREFLLDASRYWLTEGKADGFRLDYVRGVPPDFWAEFYAAMKTTKPNALLFGEAWQDAAAPGPNADDIATYYAAVPGKGPQFDGLLDFPLQMVMTEVFARGTGDASDLEHWLQRTAAQYGDAGRPVYFLDNHDVSRFLAWTGERGHERLLAALGFMAALSSPIVVFYGTETGIKGGRAAPGFNDTGRIAMPWNALDKPLMERVSAILRTRAELPALTRGARLPLLSDDRLLVMRKAHPSGDVLVAVNLASEERTVTLPAAAAGSRQDAWTPLIGSTAPVAAADGMLTWKLPGLATSWAK